MASHRTERLAEQIRTELGLLISEEVRDPRVGLAAVTAVKLTPDLRHARVFVTVTGTPGQEQETLRGLRSAGAFLRRELANTLSLRFTPELTFELDRTDQQAERVEELLKQVKKNSHED